MSYRNDTNAINDLTLSADHPDPAREEGNGYNLDLSNQDRNRGDPAPPVGPSSGQQGATYGHSPEAATLARKEEQPENGGRKNLITKVPWYRTIRAIRAIIVIIILIIGAVVGGAVGGTRHNTHSKIDNKGTGTGNDTTTTSSNISNTHTSQQSASSTAPSTSWQIAGPETGCSSTWTSDTGATPPTATPTGPGGWSR